MTKDSEKRIEKAKRKYRVAEAATDSMLTRLARAITRLHNFPHSMALLIVILLCVVGVVVWVAA